jgi:hypothetical protein
MRHGHFPVAHCEDRKSRRRPLFFLSHLTGNVLFYKLGLCLFADDVGKTPKTRRQPVVLRVPLSMKMPRFPGSPTRNQRLTAVPCAGYCPGRFIIRIATWNNAPDAARDSYRALALIEILEQPAKEIDAGRRSRLTTCRYGRKIINNQGGDDKGG